MSDYLVIVESPAKTKTIKKYLSSKYVVKSSMGHIRDLPKSRMGVEIDNNFTPQYINIRGKGDLIKDLKKAAKKAKKIYLAADPDREGEAIAWHLAHILGVDIETNCRVVFNEITKDAVKASFKKPRPIDMSLVDAQQGRRILDRLVGYNISPLLWKKVKKGLSAGRVQSVAVRLIIDREHEIRDFKPEEYWSIAGEFKKKASIFAGEFHSLNGEKIELKSEADVKTVMSALKGETFEVAKVTKKERKRNPAFAFTTSSLQQEASQKLNFRTRKTMMLAQQLYEGISLGKGGEVGLITYMRTDSTRISDTAKAEVNGYISEAYGSAFLFAGKREAKKSSNAQEAHEAIRPTSVMRSPASVKEFLSRDQFRLYKMIWERFVASQMAAAVFDTVSVDLNNNGVTFRANGSQIKFAGFMKVYTETDAEADKKENRLPALEVGETVDALKLDPKQHFTQPPPRYSEARLVKVLEELGIGRPSTYSPTIDTILKRGYVALENKRFVPSELGELVHSLVQEFFPDIVDVKFTANMEEKLDAVEEGKKAWVQVIDEFYKGFSGHLVKAEQEMEKVEVRDEPTGEDCEHCGHPMVFKMGRYGKFMACSNFPDCRNAKPIVKEIGVNCPKCDHGQIVERKSKKQRLFYGCNLYPECDYVSWDKPIDRKCPSCETMLVEKKLKKGTQVSCTNCDFKEKVQD